MRPRILLRALSSLAIDYGKYVFVDVGSGKGRGLFLASRFPFHKLIGVEITKKLHDKAERNLRVWHVDEPGRLYFVWTDVVEFEFPHQPLVLFLFHPFGPDTMRGMLERLSISYDERPREIIMIYVNREHKSVIEACRPSVELMSSFAVKYSYVTYRLFRAPLGAQPLPERIVA